MNSKNENAVTEVGQEAASDEQIEAAAKALSDLDGSPPGLAPASVRDRYTRQAEVALAAAAGVVPLPRSEPSEAEIEAAANECWNQFAAAARYETWDSQTHPEVRNGYKGCARRVLNAARGAAPVSLPAPPRDALFVLGDFTMHSGDIGHWKIECDALTDEDIECLAFMLSERLPEFSSAYGIPTGGERIAAAMQQYRTKGPRLIIDDVLTTGTSMEQARRLQSGPYIGAVIFARGPCPSWITPLFTVVPAALREYDAVSGERET